MTAGAPAPNPGPRPPTEPRPWLERIGLAGIAVVMAGLFAVVAVAAWVGGEWVLAAMSGVGAVLTVIVGAGTLFRG